MSVSPKEAKRLSLRLAEAVAAMHARGETHGMLTPAVIELTRGNAVQIGDSGVTDTAMERLRYAAPEVARREAPTSASDVFALSLIIRELIEGVPARRGDAEQLAMEAIDGRVSPPHSLGSELTGLAALAASPHAENRPSASEFAAALKETRKFRGFSLQDWVVIAVALAAVGMLAILLRSSMDERDRGAQQFEEARAAFEGFLTGTYSELDRVDDVAPLAEAGAHALSSMDAMRDEERDEADWVLLARTLLWNGEVQRILGKNDDAIGLFQRAADRARALEDRVIGTGIELRAETALGTLERARRQLGPSRRHYLKARTVGQERVAEDPDNGDARISLAQALLGLGDLSMSTGQDSAAQARSIFQQARSVLGHPSIANAPRNREVLDIRANLDKLDSIMAWAVGKPDEAIELLESHVDQARELVEMDPGRARRRWLLARGANNLGVALRDSGRILESVESFREGVEAWRLLRAMEPEEVRWRRESARTTRELADMLAVTGEWQESAALHDASLAQLVEMQDQNLLPAESVVELGEQMLDAATELLAAGNLKRARTHVVEAVARLGTRAPTDRIAPKWEIQVARTQVIEAELLLAEGKWRQAETAALDFIEHIQELAGDGSDAGLRKERARALMVSSAVRAMDGEVEVAQGARERALAIADELIREDAKDHGALGLRARVLFVLGRDRDAAQVLDQLDAIGYRGLELSAVRAATSSLRR